MKKLLTLETTCDETAAAVVTDDFQVLSSVVASQHALHQRFHGVVPEIAARAHVERILPVIDETLRKANTSLEELDAIAVANTPGLAGSLLVGLMAAKSLCLALDKPLVAINHLHAHIYACKLASGVDVFPCIGLIVSGGHSHLYRCSSASDFEYLGGTIDDAAGEAFDKVASMLGLPYPGGPSVSKAAVGGSREAHAFPRSFLKDDSRLDFSFSGLKTAVRYAITGGATSTFQRPDLSDQQIADLAASFEEAVVDCLVEKAFLACRLQQLSTLCVGGGVAANRRLRERLKQQAEAGGIDLHIAPIELCTDNAVMGAIAVERLAAGKIESLDLDFLPGLVRN
jgi:N6-L-threonylcarbamoyladenine synthase